MHAHYLENPFNRLNEVVDAFTKVYKDLKLSNPDLNAIAMSGVSGLSIGMPLCYTTGAHPIIVRKSIAGTHSKYYVECREMYIQKYIIVDDLIDSGATMRRIFGGLEETGISYDQCLNILLYNVPRRTLYFNGATEIVVNPHLKAITQELKFKREANKRKLKARHNYEE